MRNRVRPDCAYIHRELKRDGVTLQLLWKEYAQVQPNGYGRTQFCAIYREWARRLRPSMRQVHRAGEKTFLDFSGKRPSLVDRRTGALRHVELFVAVLGASRLIYAEATATQQLPDWVGAHTRMVEYFGGTTALWVPDQLKSAITRPCRYEPGVLILDLGGSYRWITRFLGGGYLELSPDDASGAGGFRLRPFALPRTERSLQFLTGWIMRLLRIGGWTVSGSDPSEIRARIEDLYAFPPDRRTMTVLVHSLPAAMWPAMGRWYGSGAWGKYFDNPADRDDLDLAEWQVIDLAGAAEHEDLCEAALFYLLERLRLSLENPDETARVKLMVVDEAWRYLRDPAVLAYLAEAAKTWRKKNAALIMATQSAVDVTGTAGAEALLESMPTKLFLANPELPDKAAEIFRLNPSEVATIRGLVSKQELYLRRPNLAATVRLEVDPESYWLYTSSARDSARRAEAVAQHGLEAALAHLAAGR